MLNRAALLMAERRNRPCAYFSLRTPWVYNDVTNGGNPRHDAGCTNGSACAVSVGGYITACFCGAEGQNIAQPKHFEQYMSDPCTMFSGTWSNFYEKSYEFPPEEIVLTNNQSVLGETPIYYPNTPITSVALDLLFADWDRVSGVGKLGFEEEDKLGKITVTLQTRSELLTLASNADIYCYLTQEYGLTFYNASGGPQVASFELPSDRTIFFRDLVSLRADVTAGIISHRLATI